MAQININDRKKQAAELLGTNSRTMVFDDNSASGGIVRRPSTVSAAAAEPTQAPAQAPRQMLQSIPRENPVTVQGHGYKFKGAAGDAQKFFDPALNRNPEADKNHAIARQQFLQRQGYRPVNPNEQGLIGKDSGMGWQARKELNRQILSNRGAMEQQKLNNQGGIDRQTLANQGQLGVQGLANEGSLRREGLQFENKTRENEQLENYKFQGDERKSDADYAESNRQLAREALLAGADPQEASNLYNNTHQGRPPNLSGLRVLQKGGTDKYSAIPSKVDSSMYRLNERTGEMEQVFDKDGQQIAGGSSQDAYQPDPQQLAESRAMVNTGTPDQARQWMATLAKSNPQLYNYLIQEELTKEALLNQ